jgi:hypothetical protein
MNLPKLLLPLGLLSLMSLSLYTPIAEAKYRPKKVGRYKGPTIPTGTRGSCDESKSADRLTPIAPLSHIGQTANPSPNLTWFVPDQKTYPMIIRLWNDRNIVWETPLQSQPGLMTQTLPIALAPNKIYRWQVVLICNPKRPSQNQVVEIPITYLPLKLTPALTPTAQIAQLSEAELWYDALDIAKTDRKLYQALLTDLVETETSATTESRPDRDLQLHLANLKRLLTP